MGEGGKGKWGMVKKGERKRERDKRINFGQ